jgi:hypothetical protein
MLPVPLYHGTSTLFLDGIARSGLGGENPISRLGVFEFASAIHPLVQEHFAADREWAGKARSFGLMVEQRSGVLNFQHGDAYLSPVMSTAVRYAVNKRYGSEILTYALDFLDELIRRKVPGIVDDLYKRFPQVFGLLDISCAPMLIEVRDVSTSDLVDEFGGDAMHNVQAVRDSLSHQGSANIDLQQTNFRLSRAVPIARVSFWLINVSRWHPLVPEYSLRLILVPGAGNLSPPQ